MSADVLNPIRRSPITFLFRLACGFPLSRPFYPRPCAHGRGARKLPNQLARKPPDAHPSNRGHTSAADPFHGVFCGVRSCPSRSYRGILPLYDRVRIHLQVAQGGIERALRRPGALSGPVQRL
jgi:hypothetical protein